jgi:hypothetical protein
MNRRPVQRGPPVQAAPADAGAVVQEDPGHIRARGEGGLDQRHMLAAILAVHIGAVMEQHLDDLPAVDPLDHDRVTQRRGPARIGHRHLSPVFQQGPAADDPAVGRGAQQRVHAIEVDRVDAVAVPIELALQLAQVLPLDGQRQAIEVPGVARAQPGRDPR